MLPVIYQDRCLYIIQLILHIFSITSKNNDENRGKNRGNDRWRVRKSMVFRQIIQLSSQALIMVFRTPCCSKLNSFDFRLPFSYSSFSCASSYFLTFTPLFSFFLDIKHKAQHVKREFWIFKTHGFETAFCLMS